MKVSKWVDMGQEVEIEIGADDIRGALAEAFAEVTKDRLGEPGPNRSEVVMTIRAIGDYLRALTDDQIAMLLPAQRQLTADFLKKQSERFALGGLFKEQNPATC